MSLFFMNNLINNPIFLSFLVVGQKPIHYQNIWNQIKWFEVLSWPIISELWWIPYPWPLTFENLVKQFGSIGTQHTGTYTWDECLKPFSLQLQYNKETVAVSVYLKITLFNPRWWLTHDFGRLGYHIQTVSRSGSSQDVCAVVSKLPLKKNIKFYYHLLLWKKESLNWYVPKKIQSFW